MRAATANEAGASGVERPRFGVVAALGIGMILAWGSSFYLLAVLATPIAMETGWPLSWIVGGMTMGLLTSGFVSPRVGREIERRGGRPVLAFSAVFLALGLFGLAVAPALPVFVAAWVILGIGMGAGLYDPAFATLGRLYGQKARGAITLLTLFGGLASTICWPFSAYLVETVGWRGTCATYAFIHLAVTLPLYLLALPREARDGVAPSPRPTKVAASDPRARGPDERRLLLALVAVALTLFSVTMSTVGVHLLTLLQAQGIALATAVALGALVGPSQVGARIIEMLLGARFHPVWTMVVATVLITTGLGLLFGEFHAVAIGLVVYGAGNGLTSIVRGTLPLALFGAEGYATLMGRIGRPVMVALAIAPSVAAVILDRYGATTTVATLASIAAVNLVIGLALAVLVSKERAERV